RIRRPGSRLVQPGGPDPRRPGRGGSDGADPPALRRPPLAAVGAGAAPLDRHQPRPGPRPDGRRRRATDRTAVPGPGIDPRAAHRRMNWVEAVGYLGSALVITSLAQTRVLWLRLFSLCGSVTFFVYAVLIGSVPIAITNTVLFVINAVHLWRLFSGREDFSLLEVAPDSPYLRRFLEFHADGIAASQPAFRGPPPGEGLPGLPRLRHPQLPGLQRRPVAVRGAGRLLPPIRRLGDRRHRPHGAPAALPAAGGVPPARRRQVDPSHLSHTSAGEKTHTSPSPSSSCRERT